MSRIVHMRGDVTGMFLLFLFGFLGLWQLFIAWKRLHGLSLTGCPDRRWLSASLGVVMVAGSCGWYFSRPNHFAYPDVEGAETVFLFILGLAAASLLQLALSSVADLYLWRGPKTVRGFTAPAVSGEEVVIEAEGAAVPATFRHPGEEAGGQAVLLLHDYGGSRGDMAALGGYLAARGHAVLAPDLDGHGENPAGISSPGMEELLAASVDRLAEEGGGTPVAVVGVGFGGTLALSLAAFDARVMKVVAVDPPAQEDNGASLVDVLRECRIRDVLASFFRPAARSGEPGKRVSLAKLLAEMPPPGPLYAGRASVIGTAGTWYNSPVTLKDFASGMDLPAPSIVPGNHATVSLREETFEAVERILLP